MKARIRKTGEIVDIISFSGDTLRGPIDSVSYIDSTGVEHVREPLNRFWDFEDIHPLQTDVVKALQAHADFFRKLAIFNAEMEGYKAENQRAAGLGYPPPYDESFFLALASKFE